MLKPIGERIVVEIKQKSEQSIGGIIIPNDSDGDLKIAEVKAVSNEINEIKINDQILISKNSGMKFNDDGKNILIVEVKDVLAIVE